MSIKTVVYIIAYRERFIYNGKEIYALEVPQI